MFTIKRSKSISPRLTLIYVAVALSVAACGGGGGGGEELLASEAVQAANGGVIAAADGSVRVDIPANALDRDTTVQVVRASTASLPGVNLSANGSPVRIQFATEAKLSAPMIVSLAADIAPTHPQIGEAARLENDIWVRTAASHFRRDQRQVITLMSAPGTVRPVLRKLQAESGDAVARGATAFLNATFGNERFFGDTLGLHTLLNDLTPAQAVAAGVQVDLAKVDPAVVAVLTGSDLAAKDAALANPAVTRALLKSDAVVGVRTFYDDPASDRASRAGITCALCHVTVEPTSFTLSSGKAALPVGPLRLDGRPNAAMNAGAILSLTPFVQSAAGLRDVLQGWGAGRFDVRALPDNPLDDGADNPTDTPPLWNFVDLASQGYRYNWDGLFRNGAAGNALASQAEAVFDLVMHANGAFGTATGSVSPELAITPPQSLLDTLAAAEAMTPGNVIDRQALLDIQAWQRSHTSPVPGQVNEVLAAQGFRLFNDKSKGNCAGCHASAEFTGPVMSTRITLTAPAGGLAGGIKTPGLRGIATTAPYFHDGSAPTLRAVLDTYAGRITPALTDDEKTAIVEYLKSL